MNRNLRIIVVGGVTNMSNIEETNDQLLVRRQKMTAIQEKGLDPFGSKFVRTHLSNQVIAEFDAVY